MEKWQAQIYRCIALFGKPEPRDAHIAPISQDESCFGKHLLEKVMFSSCFKQCLELTIIYLIHFHTVRIDHVLVYSALTTSLLENY